MSDTAMRNRRSARRNRSHRRGANLVEFAFVLPVLLLFIFAGIELARVNMIRNTIENAAYEGARRGIVPGATADDCRGETQSLLDIVGITNATVDVEPEVIEDETDMITVTVQVPISLTNGYVTAQWFQGKTLRSSVALPREMY